MSSDTRKSSSSARAPPGIRPRSTPRAANLEPILFEGGGATIEPITIRAASS